VQYLIKIPWLKICIVTGVPGMTALTLPEITIVSPSLYVLASVFTSITDSANGGYGNREGQMLTQAITPHKMDIVVSEGKVISAITDETWDEINLQYVQSLSKLPSSDESIVPFEGMATDYSSLVNAIESRGVLVEHIDEIASEG
jgi:tRNA-binding EMAP/Myf-like protein